MKLFHTEVTCFANVDLVYLALMQSVALQVCI